MIAKSAIEAFLNRKLRDSSRSKLVPKEDLDSWLRDNQVQTETAPRYAQKVCLYLGLRNDAFLFLLGTGAGKTKVCYDLYQNRWGSQEVDRMLVLVPNYVNLEEWENEARRHASGLRVKALTMSGADARMAVIEDLDVDVVVITYASLAVLCSKKVAEIKDHELTGKNKQKHNPAKADKLARNFQMLVLDEITDMGGHKSLYFRCVKRLRKTIPYCYGLTATLFDKDPSGAWAPFNVIDDGWSLGDTFGLFREAFYRMKEGYFALEWTFRMKMKGEVSRRLRHCSVRFTEEECQDLPETMGGLRGERFMELRSTLSQEASVYYAKITKTLAESMGEYTVVDSAYNRQRMATSGWMGVTTEEGEKVEVVFTKNPKFDSVIAKLREIPEDESVVVVHWFTGTGKLFEKRLSKEKLKYVTINGKTTPGKKSANMKAFKQRETRILLASTAISKGVNLQDCCRYMIFLESPDDARERWQMESRIVRERTEGDHGTCFIYDAVTVGTRDEDILKANREGKDMHTVIVDQLKAKS